MTDAHARNRSTFAAPEVVGSYTTLTELTPCEQMIFERHVPHGEMCSTSVSVPVVQRHISLSATYASASTTPCRCSRRHVDSIPTRISLSGTDLTLSPFVGASFDAVVFSFNGIDYHHPDDARLRCFDRVQRVLRPQECSWSRHSNRRRSSRQPSEGHAIRRPGIARCVTTRRAARLLRTRVFRWGEGYASDPVHGGLGTHAATPWWYYVLTRL